MNRPATTLAACALLCLTGCNASPSASSANSTDRIQALEQLGGSGKETNVPKMLPSLSSDDPLVRWTAQHALLTLTGTTNGYDWAARRVQRLTAIETWVQWCQDRGIATKGLG